MKEYFIYATSNPAPFCGDTSEGFIKGTSPEDALSKYKKKYKHPAGLYYAAVYKDANDYHKNKAILAEYNSPNKVNKVYG